MKMFAVKTSIRATPELIWALLTERGLACEFRPGHLYPHWLYS
jgi:hypothetical protein